MVLRVELCTLIFIYLFKTLFPEGNPISCKLIFPGALEKL